MFKAKLLTQEHEKRVKVYVAGRSKAPMKITKLHVKKTRKLYTLGWYFTGDAQVLNQLLLL
jgi:hypothetical protein